MCQSMHKELDKNGLLPCPFCSAPGKLVHCEIHCKDSDSSLGWYIACTKCFCELGYAQTWTDIATGEFETAEEAIAAWNMRRQTAP